MTDIDPVTLQVTGRTTRRVLRWSVPVNDEWHKIGGGQVLHVDVRDDLSIVEVWTLEHLQHDWPESDVYSKRSVRVFGTGHLLDDLAGVHLGSAVVFGRRMVWHLFEAA